MADPDSMLAEVIDGDADAATLARVADLVRTDAAVRERFLAQVAISGALRARHLPATRLAELRQRTLGTLVNADDLAQTGRSVLERLPARPMPPTRRSWWLPLSVAAVAALLLIALLIPTTPPAAALIAGGDGATLMRQGTPVQITVGLPLTNGDRFTSGAQPLTLSFLDGTQVVLAADSALVLERVAAGKRLRLERGQVVAQVARQPDGEPLLALTARSTLTVVGTRFHLATAEHSDFVAVQEGSVMVRRGDDSAEATVTVGRGLVIGGDQPLNTIAITTPAAATPSTAVDVGGWSGTGSGLRGDYYADHNFTRLAGSRVDPQIRFDWPGAPLDTMRADHFTVRWSGRIQPRVSGVHTFTIRADDGVRLWIDGRVLIDTWKRPDIADQQGGIALEAGRLYDLRLDYFENNKEGEITLWWQAAGQAKEIVPTSQLYPP